MTPALFSPTKIGNMELSHRVVLAPLTRLRNTKDHIPTPMMTDYYTQRTTPGGFLISEACVISATAGGYPYCPGIYTEEHINAWKTIVDAVHAKGGYIYLQIWHIGRASTSACMPNNEKPWAPSPIAIKGVDVIGQPYEEPRELDQENIDIIVRDFAQAAKNAVKAGFDGVEIHGANGYVIDQFINTSSNIRTDKYGGPIENRCRLCLDVVDAVAEAVGPERTAIRFSPWSDFQDMKDDTPYETWGYLCKEIQRRHPKLSYIHFIEARDDYAYHEPGTEKNTIDPFREAWKGPIVSSGGYTTHPEKAFEVAAETGDLIAFGRSFIANPDLPERLKNGWPLQKYDRSTFYTQDEAGYLDYPFYAPESA
ncbi:uncharacterized protein BYT42DRAFT_567784 [Radiomyces spectabilis]|uniref:uncharacterized protein n=1 Tax=Radiomyces spectabilis TaxID=64574 RepID=UPI00221E458D|nr:uncharacterized protein BYT42DRAFT_567784 [Radiomyces spectabilis]KAI8379163.1 hypothetical protein BYT42DRAFT_567784 [Radiomyces spectabilis]